MATYRITLDVSNWRENFPSLRVNVEVIAALPSEARKRVRTVYVSRDLQTVNLTGGVGKDGYYYQEWRIVRTRKVPTRQPRCEWFLGCRNLATGTVPHPILGEVPACDRCAKRATE